VEILYWLGLVICIVTGIWLLVLAFKTSVWWGLGSLIIPFVSLIFVFMHWQVAKRPFLISLAGVALVVVAILSNPAMIESL
jgi:hypothetical protein